MQANLSDAVREVVSDANGHEDVYDIVDRARSAIIDADGISLFNLETPHPDFGSVHWIVGRPGDEDSGYLVLAIPHHADEGDAWPLFTAASDDLGDAFRQLLPDCGAPIMANDQV